MARYIISKDETVQRGENFSRRSVIPAPGTTEMLLEIKEDPNRGQVARMAYWLW